jgi:uncharacterized membrane protein YgcG
MGQSISNQKLKIEGKLLNRMIRLIVIFELVFFKTTSVIAGGYIATFKTSGGFPFEKSESLMKMCAAASSKILTAVCNPTLLGVTCSVGATVTGTATESAGIGLAASAACLGIVKGQEALCETEVTANNKCYTSVITASEDENHGKCAEGARMTATLSCKETCAGPQYEACFPGCEEGLTATNIAECNRVAGQIKTEAEAGMMADKTTGLAYAAIAASALANLMGLLNSSKKSKDQLENKVAATPDGSSSSGASSSGASSSGASGSSSGSSGSSSGSGSSGSSSGGNGITSAGNFASSGSSGTASSGTSSTSSGGTSGSGSSGTGGTNSNLANKATLKNCAAGDFACLCSAGSKYKPLECDSSCMKNNSPDLQCVSSKYGMENYPGYGGSSMRLDGQGRPVDVTNLDGGAGGGSGGGFSGGPASGDAIPKAEVSTSDPKAGKGSSDDAAGGGSGYTSTGPGAAETDGSARNANKRGRDIASLGGSPIPVAAGSPFASKNGNLFELVSKRYFAECMKGQTMAGDCIK